MMEDDIIRVQTEGIIRNAHVWKEEFSWTPDGTPRAVVVVRVPINGELSKAVVPWWERHKKDAAPPAPAPAPPKLAEPVYTGLIIDASGLSVRPVLLPRVLSSQNKWVVYGPEVAEKRTAILNGLSGYSGSVGAAKKSTKAGANPLVIKVQSVSGDGAEDLLISEEDSLKILAADAKGKFLKECKVVIVVN
jgi:hypothetical protein